MRSLSNHYYFGVLKVKALDSLLNFYDLKRWLVDEMKVESINHLGSLWKLILLYKMRQSSSPFKNLFIFVCSTSLNETNDLSKLCWWATIYLLWMTKLDRGCYHFIEGLVEGMSLHRLWLVFNQGEELEINHTCCIGNKTLLRAKVHLTPWVCRLAIPSIALIPLVL